MIRLPGAIRWLAFCYTTATIFAVLPGPWPTYRLKRWA